MTLSIPYRRTPSIPYTSIPYRRPLSHTGGPMTPSIPYRRPTDPLYPIQEAPLTSSGYYEGKELVQACGKFLVLEKMMKRLKEQGHRVLIFSQV